MRKRILSFVMAVMLIISCLPAVPVHADNEAFKAALATFCDYTPTDAQVFTWSYIISSLKADGLTNNAIAGVCGNVLHESGGGIYAVEGMYTADAQKACGKHYKNFVTGESYNYGSYEPPKSRRGTNAGSSGNGHGIVQWSFGRAVNLSNSCNNLPDGIGYVTVTHKEWRTELPRWVLNSNGTYTYYYTTNTYKIPDLPGQVLFMIKELHGDYAGVRADMQSASSPESACEIFRSRYEVGGAASKESRKAAAGRAIQMIEICTGTVGEAPPASNGGGQYGTQQGFQSVGSELVNAGYWSESQLASYCSLTETNLEETLLKVANRSNLGQKDLEGLTDWERNHEGNLKENGYVATLRWIVSLVGILMTLWALFVYLAFWFDHINSFFYLDMLHILTFGQLHICPPGDKPTFDIKKKVKTKTVSHFQIICICLTALLFGALLISGVFYQAVNRLVHLILSFFR